MRNLIAGLSGGSGAFAAAGICAVLVAAGFWVQAGRDAPTLPSQVAAIPTAQTPETAPSDDNAPQVTETASSPEVGETPAPTPPAFDEVRREADGMTVIAGRAMPGAQVVVLKDGEIIAEGTADSAGKFASLAIIPPDGAGHILSLLQRFDGQELPSEEEIILAPMTAPVVAEAVAPPEPTETVEAPEPKAEAPVVVAQADEDVVLPEAATQTPEPQVAEAPNAEADQPEVKTAQAPTPQVETPAEAEPKANTAPETVVTQVQEPESEAPQGEVSTTELAEVAPVTETVAETEVAAPTLPTDTAVVEAEPLQAAALLGDPIVSDSPTATVPVTDQPTGAPSDTTSPTVPEQEPTEAAEPVIEPAVVAALAPALEADATPEPTPAPSEIAAPAAVTAPQAAPKPAAVAVLKSTAEGVELLNTSSPEAMTNVAIDTISYSDQGEVQLAGRAQSQTTSVRVYLDNNSVVNLPVDAQGRWRGELPDVDQGVYTLRVDEVSQSGKVTSRVETPFKREDAAVLAAAAAAQDGAIKAITVQKGATLWAIARERYGDGQLYVRVVTANSALIRNPDLIYPGQVFDLPD